MPALSSRDRMLRALHFQDVDRVPCCFMSFTALRRRVHEDLYALVDAELAMGLDSMLFIPPASRAQRPEHPDLRGLPVRFGPEVRTGTVREPGRLRREYRTPAGVLSTAVQLSDDWPHGDLIPFVDDYQVPRAIKRLVTGPDDLPALRHLLLPPGERDIAQFRAEADRARSFCAARGVLLAGGWGVGMDMLNWLCGMENVMVFIEEQPRMIIDLLEMIHVWNMERMRLVLSAPVDLYIRRAWYEGCDFIARGFFREHVLPRLKAEANLAHDHGVLFGYICTSGVGPMLDFYLDAGIDVLIGIDPVQGTHTDLQGIRKKLGGRIALWGGVSGAITVEMGTEDDIRAAVGRAIEALGPTGFVLSPVDNITIDAPKTWRNIEALIRTAREPVSL